MRVAEPLQLLITNLDYDDFKGRLCIGRVTAGHLMVGEQVVVSKPGALLCQHHFWGALSCLPTVSLSKTRPCCSCCFLACTLNVGVTAFQQQRVCCRR